MASRNIPPVKMNRLLAIFSSLLVWSGVLAQIPDSTFWVTNGPVKSLQLKDSILFVGGEFDHIDPISGSFVRLDTFTALPDPAVFKVNGTVHAMARDFRGYVYVAGEFTRAGHQNVENLFRLRPNGSFDNNFVHTVNGPIYCLNARDSILYIGGEFTQIDGEPRTNAAALDLNLNDVSPFDPQVNGPVYCMAQDTAYGYLLIGGDFTGVRTFSPPYIAKVSFEFGDPLTFNAVPWTATPNTNGPVYALEVCNEEVYMGGEFTSFSSIQRRGLAVLNLSNGLISGKNAGCNGKVYALTLQAERLYVGGDFSLMGGNFRDNLACLDTGMTLLPWSPATDDVVRCIGALDSNSLMIGGDFIQVNGDTCMRAAIIDTIGIGFVHNWDPEINATVWAVLADTLHRMYAGGSFFAMGGFTRRNLCSININTGRATAWNPFVNYGVETLQLSGDTLYLSGQFTVVNNLTRDRLAAIDISTFSTTSFNPACDGLVRTIAVTDSFVYVGGNFTMLGGFPRGNIGRVDKFSGLTNYWNPNCLGTVNSVLPTDEWIYVAGFYNTIGGMTRNNLSRISPVNGGADWNWICDTDDGIYRAEFYNNEMILGGWFNTINGQSSPDFARMDTATLLLQPAPFLTNGYVQTFTRYNDDFFVSGNFNLIDNGYKPYLFDYDVVNGAPDVWTPAPDAPTATMVATADRIFIGGGMKVTGGVYQPYLQSLNVQWVTGTDDIASNPTTDFRMYPIPASTEMNIVVNSETTISKYTITDIAGKQVKSDDVSFQNGQATINVSELGSGMYFITLVEDGNWITQRIVIAR